MTNKTILVVGAGFAGSTVARQLADHGHEVVVMEKRDHIGGNAYDEHDAHGVLVHRYGPHIFHTNSERIFGYLGRFTSWRGYQHRVLSWVDGSLYPFPVNRTTLNLLYNLEMDEAEAAEFLSRIRVPIERIKTSKDAVLASVGTDLYEKFYLNYTRKQWGLEPDELKAAVAARIPVRTNSDDRYFTDRYQAMPAEGYTQLFKNLLDHPNIHLTLSEEFNSSTRRQAYRHTVYTGPIDAFFLHCYGPLPYRSLRFEHQHLPMEQFQSTGTVNYPNSQDFTRITEFKHLTGQSHAGTSIVREYPQNTGDPYYPIPTGSNEALFKKYDALASAQKNVSFVGRLAQYRYYNMDQVVAAALKTSEDLIKNI